MQTLKLNESFHSLVLGDELLDTRKLFFEFDATYKNMLSSENKKNRFQTKALFTRVWINLNPIHFLRGIYTGADPELMAFTRVWIHLDFMNSS